MICPACEAEGLSSEVIEQGSTVGLILSHMFFDEYGRRHAHDPNDHINTYGCSQGHRFNITWQALCPALDCSYGEGPSLVALYISDDSHV